MSEVELGDLLSSTITAVVQAQEKLDDYTLQRRTEYEEAPAGSLALPPLWYVFRNVAIELELSANVSSTTETRLLCKTLNPTTVSLYGYQASAGLRVRVLMGPQGPLPMKPADE